MSAREQATLDPMLVEPTLDPAAGGAPRSGETLAPGTFVGSWRVERALEGRASQADLYVVRSGGREGVLKRYHPGFRPVAGVMLAQRDGGERHIVPLLDEGEHEGRHVEVYPRLRAVTLRELVEAGEADGAFVRDVLLPQLSDALAFLRERGIVHGDLAPDNVLVSEGRDSVWLADFGVALPVPPPGSLVARRGRPDFSPRVYELDGRVRMGAGYDYGSLGLLLAYAVLGMSPIAHLARAEADELLRSGRAFLPLPDDLGRLCVALSRPFGGASDGDAICAAFLAGAEAGDAAGSPGEPSRRRNGPEPLEVGVSEGRVLMASTPQELLELLEGHWELARQLVGSQRLRRYLECRRAGRRLLALMDSVAGEGADAQVFALCCGLRRVVGGPGLGPLCWLGERYDDVIELMGRIADGGAPREVERFLSGSLLVTYCEAAGLGEPVVAEARRLLASSPRARDVARAAVEVFTGMGEDLVIDGEVVEDVAELVRWLSGASLEAVARATRDPALRGWLYRRGFEGVFREVDSIS